jgi:hypothetical protein
MDLWENGRLECLAKLTKWDDLAANTLEEVEHDTKRLFDERYTDPYLSYFIVSNSKVKQRWPDLWQFVDTANTAATASTALPQFYTPHTHTHTHTHTRTVIRGSPSGLTRSWLAFEAGVGVPARAGAGVDHEGRPGPIALLRQPILLPLSVQVGLPPPAGPCGPPP